MTSHMLRFAIILLLAGLGTIACTTGEPENPILNEVTIDGHTVTEIDLEALPEEVTRIGLSEFTDNFEVIRLENSREALVENTRLHFEDDFFLLGTQNFPGASRLLRFDYDGNFLNEIGAAGRGPGEHAGQYTSNLEYYEEDNTVLVHWGGFEHRQLFRPDGTFLRDVRMPMRLMSTIGRYSEDEWFSYGNTVGRPMYPRDSVKVVFFTGDGEVTGRIDRTTYVPENTTGYTPFGSASDFTFNGQTKVYYPDDHTIYRISDRDLIPDAVIRPGDQVTPFNEVIASEDLLDTYYLEILEETDRNWFIKKMIFSQAEIEEFENEPGRWSTTFDTRDQLIVIDKETNRGKTYEFTEDILHMMPEEMAGRMFTWQEGFGMHFALPPDLILSFEEASENLDQRTPEVVEKLKVLEGLSIDDNYIIFTFSVPEEVVIE